MQKRPLRSSDYIVGKGRPPVATRWKAGQSGNPRGRPKGSKTLMALIGEVLQQTLVVQERGAPRRIAAREAVVRQLINQAMKGDLRAIAFLMANDVEIAKAVTPMPTIPATASADEAAKIYLSMIKQVRG